MKKLLIILFIMPFCFISCNENRKQNINKKTKIAEEDSLTVKSKKLEEAYKDSNYTLFFDLFPDSFDEFLKLYGFDDKKGAMPLYYAYDEHIRLVFGSVVYNEDKFIPKIFHLAKDGHWEADASGLLSDEIGKFVVNHPNKIVNYLIRQTDEEVTGFWYFVFDGPIPNKEKFDKIYDKIKPLNSRQAEIIKIVFDGMEVWI